MIRNPYLWSVFRLILSLKGSKMRIFSLNPLIFKLKYIGFQERNRDVTIITHAFRTFKPCKKTLGQRLIHAYYFSDLRILARFISRIWVFSLYLRLLFKQLQWCHEACHHTASLCIIPIEKPLIKTSHRFSEEKSLATFLLQGIRHLSTLYGNILYKLKN